MLKRHLISHLNKRWHRLIEEGGSHLARNRTHVNAEYHSYSKCIPIFCHFSCMLRNYFDRIITGCVRCVCIAWSDKIKLVLHNGQQMCVKWRWMAGRARPIYSKQFHRRMCLNGIRRCSHPVPIAHFSMQYLPRCVTHQADTNDEQTKWIDLRRQPTKWSWYSLRNSLSCINHQLCAMTATIFGTTQIRMHRESRLIASFMDALRHTTHYLSFSLIKESAQSHRSSIAQRNP